MNLDELINPMPFAGRTGITVATFTQTQSAQTVDTS